MSPKMIPVSAILNPSKVAPEGQVLVWLLVGSGQLYAEQRILGTNDGKEPPDNSLGAMPPIATPLSSAGNLCSVIVNSLPIVYGMLSHTRDKDSVNLLAKISPYVNPLEKPFARIYSEFGALAAVADPKGETSYIFFLQDVNGQARLKRATLKNERINGPIDDIISATVATTSQLAACWDPVYREPVVFYETPHDMLAMYSNKQQTTFRSTTSGFLHGTGLAAVQGYDANGVSNIWLYYVNNQGGFLRRITSATSWQRAQALDAELPDQGAMLSAVFQAATKATDAAVHVFYQRKDDHLITDFEDDLHNTFKDSE